MKLILAIEILTALVGCCAAQTQAERQQLLDLGNSTRYPQLNEHDCTAAYNASKQYLPPDPYDKPVWREAKKGVAQEWFNAGASDGRLSSNIYNKTLYCGWANRDKKLDQFKKVIPYLYCDGKDGGPPAIQSVVHWINGQCTLIEGQISYDMPTGCGCKNQPPTPNGAEIL